jgi:toxin ParE1/3/4
VTPRVRILRRAEKDLAEIARYVARDSPDNAARLVDALFDTIEGLSQFPARGATPRDPRLRQHGYRFLAEGAYLIFYKVLRSEIRVYRVVHGKRSYEGWL